MNAKQWRELRKKREALLEREHKIFPTIHRVSTRREPWTVLNITREMWFRLRPGTRRQLMTDVRSMYNRQVLKVSIDLSRTLSGAGEQTSAKRIMRELEGARNIEDVKRGLEKITRMKPPEWFARDIAARMGIKVEKK